MTTANKEIVLYYLDLVNLEDQISNYNNKEAYYSWSMTPRDVKQMHAFYLQRVKLSFNTPSESLKVFDLLTKPQQDLVNSHYRRGLRIEKLVNSNHSKEEIKQKVYKIFKADPFFKWIKPEQLGLGTMMRAISDCSGINGEIYSKFYKKILED